jgi:hypothetical protein
MQPRSFDGNDSDTPVIWVHFAFPHQPGFKVQEGRCRISGEILTGSVSCRPPSTPGEGQAPDSERH